VIPRSDHFFVPATACRVLIRHLETLRELEAACDFRRLHFGVLLVEWVAQSWLIFVVVVFVGSERTSTESTIRQLHGLLLLALAAKRPKVHHIGGGLVVVLKIVLILGITKPRPLLQAVGSLASFMQPLGLVFASFLPLPSVVAT